MVRVCSFLCKTKTTMITLAIWINLQLQKTKIIKKVKRTHKEIFKFNNSSMQWIQQPMFKIKCWQLGVSKTVLGKPSTDSQAEELEMLISI